MNELNIKADKFYLLVKEAYFSDEFLAFKNKAKEIIVNGFKSKKNVDELSKISKHIVYNIDKFGETKDKEYYKQAKSLLNDFIKAAEVTVDNKTKAILTLQDLSIYFGKVVGENLNVAIKIFFESNKRDDNLEKGLRDNLQVFVNKYYEFQSSLLAAINANDLKNANKHFTNLYKTYANIKKLIIECVFYKNGAQNIKIMFNTNFSIIEKYFENIKL
jgi:hypothetical protein